MQQVEIIDGRPFRIDEVVSTMVIDGGAVVFQDAREAQNPTGGLSPTKFLDDIKTLPQRLDRLIARGQSRRRRNGRL